MSYNDDLPFGVRSARHYVSTHIPEFAQLIEPRVKKEDLFDVVDLLMENPKYLAALLQNNFSTNMEQRYKHVLERIISESLLIIMMGSRGAGKTAQVFKVVEDTLKAGYRKDIYWFGYSKAIKEAFPEVKQTTNIRKLENCILLFDEAAVFMGNRESMTRERIDFLKHIPVMRHKGITTFYLTQIDRIDTQLWEFCDWVWFKPYPSMNFAESKIKMDYIHQFMIPRLKNQNYVFDRQNGIPFFFDTKLPDRWNDDISTPYNLISEKDEAIEFYMDLKESDLSDRQIETMLMLRGWKLEELFEDLDTQPMSKGNQALLKGTDIKVCPKCGGLRFQSKGKRGGKQRLECSTCGMSGYEEKFLIKP